MKTHGTIALEDHKIFPYIAWVIIIAFAIFTGQLALQLYTTTNNLASKSTQLETIVNDHSDRLNSLEAELNKHAE